MATYDVVIVGAGPYGLAAHNQLRRIKGLEVRVFGEPMSFWENAMPSGMFLRSNWTATQIADPDHSLTLENYAAENGTAVTMPVPIDRFIQYGKWYQRKSLPDLDRRKVALIETAPGGFRITLADGEQLASRRVVVAAGVRDFAYRPPEFDSFPDALVSHTCGHSDPAEFAGKDVLVIGGGQSALESAALLHENGAGVEVLTRELHLHWLQGWTSRVLHHHLGRIVRRLLYAPTDVGPAGISQLMARPDLLRRLPRELQNRLRERSIRPAGARWLVDRLRDVPIRLGYFIESTKVVGDRVHVRLNDGSERVVHHVLLGTGYQVDIGKYKFLSPELLKCVQLFNGFPILREGLETSLAGLHILGAPGSWSFGPLLMFVSGTHYASHSLAGHIERNSSRNGHGGR